jgi:ubiquinone biosynthesis protein COQ4
MKRTCPRVSYLAVVAEAWRHGRKAANLVAIDYERLMAESLTDARRRLHIAQPARYEAIRPDERNAFRFPAEPILSGVWPHETA